MVKLVLEQLSSLEKIFLNKKPQALGYNHASILKGELFSYQIAYSCHGQNKIDVSISLDSTIKDKIGIKLVGNSPSELPAYAHEHDDNYITTEPGLFPDILYDLERNFIEVTKTYRSLWIEVEADKDIAPGKYPITVTFENTNLNICESKTFFLEVLNATLPEQELIYTQWFYSDCIATYYNVEVFSEKHWILVDQFIEMAADNGIKIRISTFLTSHKRIILKIIMRQKKW